MSDSVHAKASARSSRCRGFTLAELAIVVLVIALLLGGLTLTLSTQTELRRIEDTQRTLDLAKEALIGFAITRGRLPCPANPAIATGAANAGVEQLPAGAPPQLCASQFGVLPWVTLGVPETDAWGRRLSYRVFNDFADTDNVTVGPLGAPGCLAAPGAFDATKPSFQLCSIGNLQVQTRNPADRSLQNLSLDLGAVIVSHGANGFGGRAPDGTLLAAPPGLDEQANANIPAGTTAFRSRELTRPPAGACDDTAAGTPACEFDDLVVWVPTVVLMNRMVASGKLP
jgi:prepilin-type N-terminal cleavage/methylation domain-containing protein